MKDDLLISDDERRGLMRAAAAIRALPPTGGTVQSLFVALQNGFANCILNAANVGHDPEVFQIGNPVSKTGGDYRFAGIIVSVFRKMGGATRYVVEDDRGVLHIYSAGNLRHREIFADAYEAKP